MTRSGRIRTSSMLLAVGAILGLAAVWVFLLPVRINGHKERYINRIRENIDQALRSYEQTFDGMYPPSDDAAVGSGAECLYYYLMGPRGQGWGPNPADGGVPANYALGPARELSESWLVGGGRDGVRKYFVDDDPDNPQPILYYRANTAVQPGGTEPVRYDQVYNRLDNARFWTPTAQEWHRYIANPASPSEAPFNPHSYLLISPGEDRQFGYVDGQCDDFANYKRPR